jgi:hypothetical protein
MGGVVEGRVTNPLHCQVSISWLKDLESLEAVEGYDHIMPKMDKFQWKLG